ncbi:MAG: hypothetical protein IJZ80_09685 [Clostridia bacterium]|nr:hypothetical protein [Clostridia bacterium]
MHFRKTKRLLAPVLSILLIAAMLIPLTILPASAVEENTSLDNNLIIHYDFEGENPLADKATAGASTDDLTAYIQTGANKSAAMTDEQFETYFKVKDGVITSADGPLTTEAATPVAIALVTAEASTNDGKSKDLYSVTKDNTTTDVTWVVRYSIAEVGNYAIFDSDHSSNASLTYFLRSDRNTRLYYSNGTKGGSTNSAFTNGYSKDTWLNTAITRKYDTNSQKWTFTVVTYNDAMTAVLAKQTIEGQSIYATDWGRLSLFAVVNEKTFTKETSAGQAIYNVAQQLSIDDFRIYNVALADEQIETLIADELVDKGVKTANVKTEGVQIKEDNKGTDDTADDTFSVRLIAQIKGKNYSTAGFKVTASYTGQEGTPAEKDLAVTVAYQSLNAQGYEGIITPDEGYYLIAVVIKDIPAAHKDSLSFTFTPYAVGSDDKLTYTDKPAVYNIKAGSVQYVVENEA